MDWSHTIIPIGNNKIKLELEEKAKFTILKSGDPKAQVLYQEMEFGNYILFSNFNHSGEKLDPPSDQMI